MSNRIQKTEEKYNQTEEEKIVSDSCSQIERDGVRDNLQSVQMEMEECVDAYNEMRSANHLTNQEICELMKKNIIQAHKLETLVENSVRSIDIRRMYVGQCGNFEETLKNLPYQNYDYTKVVDICCENVIGYVPIPIGIAGPLLMDNEIYYVPMATTEGCLVASTNRGARAILESNGVISRVVTDSMIKEPIVKFSSIKSARDAMCWINDEKNFEIIKKAFYSGSQKAHLQKVTVQVVASYLFIRFSSTTGDSMGINMISKGTEAALALMKERFEDMSVLSLVGNFCTDKKSSAVNWIEGRGKGVICEILIPERVLRKVLKTTTIAMVEANLSKNLVGSTVAGSIGGFNTHAANIVTAIYIATGQDPALNVSSSNCMTIMEAVGEDNKDLYISCSMPSIEIGTVGGGTALPAQAACLEMLGVQGADHENPGKNAKTLARIVCSSVLAGELSAMASLTEGTLVQSHLTYNRLVEDDFIVFTECKFIEGPGIFEYLM